MDHTRHLFKPILIFILSIFCFVPYLGAVHLFDWDEINFAECAREMIVAQDYLHVKIGFTTFYEKPPLFIWMQVWSMKMFGINEFAARLPNAICGIISLQVLYVLGKKIHNKRFAILWVVSYTCSILPHFYFKSGIMDPWFNLFIFTALYFLYQFHTDEKKKKFLWLGGLLLGAAVLIKGPVAILLILLCLITWFVYHNFNLLRQRSLAGTKLPIKLHDLFLFICLATLPLVIWYGYDFVQNGPGLIKGFFAYQLKLFKTEDAGHGGFPGYHFFVILIGCFPASIFALGKIFKKLDSDSFALWMKILFWVVIILFSIVQSKIVHYSSLCYFPVTYFSALFLVDLFDKKIFFSKLQRVLMIMIVLLFALSIIATPFLGKHIESLRFLFKGNPFALGNLEAQVDWTYSGSWLGLIFLLLAFLAILYFSKRDFVKASVLLFTASIVLIQGGLYCFIQNIEAYSQRAAIEFFQSVEGKDVYLATYPYKSYAHYFYGNIKPNQIRLNETNIMDYYLFSDKLDKPLFLSTKITSANDVELKNCSLLYKKNGFAFFTRLPNKQ